MSSWPEIQAYLSDRPTTTIPSTQCPLCLEKTPIKGVPFAPAQEEGSSSGGSGGGGNNAAALGQQHSPASSVLPCSHIICSKCLGEFFEALHDDLSNAACPTCCDHVIPPFPLPHPSNHIKPEFVPVLLDASHDRQLATWLGNGNKRVPVSSKQLCFPCIWEAEQYALFVLLLVTGTKKFSVKATRRDMLMGHFLKAVFRKEPSTSAAEEDLAQWFIDMEDGFLNHYSDLLRKVSE